MSMEHNTIKSFGFAFRGLATAIKREPNFKIQTAIATAVILLGFVLKISSVEWLIILITICLVLVMEMINTVLEALVNIVSPQIQEGARVAKDVAAAAVLTSSIFSIIVGILIFVPKILK